MVNSSRAIAIHRKFQTRRAAEDSTRLYGEAAQHSMRLSVDGYTPLVCRVCAAGTHAFADVKFPRACRLRRHTPYARNPPAAGFVLQGRVGEGVSDIIDEPKFQFLA